MTYRILLSLSLLIAPLMTSAWACPCNDKKAACACPGGAASCPSTCAHADPAKKGDGKKDDGKAGQPAPKK